MGRRDLDDGDPHAVGHQVAGSGTRTFLTYRHSGRARAQTTRCGCMSYQSPLPLESVIFHVTTCATYTHRAPRARAGARAELSR